MNRFLLAVIATLIATPAFACAMRMPEKVHLADAFDQIDAPTVQAANVEVVAEVKPVEAVAPVAPVAPTEPAVIPEVNAAPAAAPIPVTAPPMAAAPKG